MAVSAKFLDLVSALVQMVMGLKELVCAYYWLTSPLHEPNMRALDLIELHLHELDPHQIDAARPMFQCPDMHVLPSGQCSVLTCSCWPLAHRNAYSTASAVSQRHARHTHWPFEAHFIVWGLPSILWLPLCFNLLYFTDWSPDSSRWQAKKPEAEPLAS
jgi:hypothetical protein